MGPINLPPNMPAWAQTLFWLLVVVVLAIGVTLPLAIRAYGTIRGVLNRMQQQNHEVAQTVERARVQAERAGAATARVAETLNGQFDDRLRAAFAAAARDPELLRVSVATAGVVTEDDLHAAMRHHEEGRFHDNAAPVGPGPGGPLIVPGGGGVEGAAGGAAPGAGGRLTVPVNPHRIGWEG